MAPRADTEKIILYNGEVSCRDSSYPFLMGASLDGLSTTLNFYSHYGDPLFVVRQAGEGTAYLLQVDELRRYAISEEGGFATLMRKIGGEYSLRGILTGTLPFQEREGDLFVTKRGFLYRGDGFSVVCDDHMRMVEAGYRVGNLSLDLAYSYDREDGELPTAISVLVHGCEFNLDVERVHREGE